MCKIISDGEELFSGRCSFNMTDGRMMESSLVEVFHLPVEAEAKVKVARPNFQKTSHAAVSSDKNVSSHVRSKMGISESKLFCHLVPKKQSTSAV